MSTVVGWLVEVLVRRRGIVLAVAALVVAASTVLALRLRLVTDLAELLPRDAPAVLATQRVQARLGGVSPLQIAIESPDRAANLRYAQALADTLAREPRSLIASVAYHARAERAFFERNWWLYAERADLELIRDRLAIEINRRKNPLLVDLEADDDRGALDELEARLRDRAAKVDRFPDGYFMTPDGGLVVVLLWPTETMFRERAGEPLVARVREIVAAQPPTGFHPAMRVHLAGALYDGILERRALESDLAWSSVVCLVLVGLAVVLFYRRLAAVPLMATPALCGVAVAFAAAWLAFGHLNATTAFLGPIVLGNGINAAIIQLARYEEERRAGADLEAAIRTSVLATMRPTAIAALAAAISYGSLALTSFRGFNQFGVIGAVGMIASWLATILVLPALVATVDRRRAAAAPRGLALGVPFARLAGRAPGVVAAVGALVTVVAVVALVPFARDPFEYDLRRLRSDEGVERRELVQRIGSIFGTFTPTVLLADRADQPAAIAEVLRARDRARPGLVGDIVTLDSLLPGAPAAQREKLAILDEIRGLVQDRLIDEDEAARLERWRPPPDLAVITTAALPEMVLRPFRDVDGELAPLVLVYRGPNISFWNGRELIRLAELVRSVELDDGTTIYAGGNVVVFAEMIEVIVAEGPTATLVSLLGVALLVFALARGLRGALIVLAALFTGVLWMAGAAALASERVNFMNFIALPLTFGIGVDYAVNVYLRHRRVDAGSIDETLRATGSAVALCSLSTVIGYGSLMFADSQGLRSFGALAILGELACLTVALLVMPAGLLLGERRAKRRPPGPGAPPADG